jgi:hypothetical protein
MQFEKKWINNFSREYLKENRPFEGDAIKIRRTLGKQVLGIRRTDCQAHDRLRIAGVEADTL